VIGLSSLITHLQTDSEGVERANNSKYGLGAGIWTQNLSRAHQVAARLQSGLVWVNTHHRNDPSSPWGGMKESGVGRENGIEAFEACKFFFFLYLIYGFMSYSIAQIRRASRLS